MFSIFFILPKLISIIQRSHFNVYSANLFAFFSAKQLGILKVLSDRKWSYWFYCDICGEIWEWEEEEIFVGKHLGNFLPGKTLYLKELWNAIFILLSTLKEVFTIFRNLYFILNNSQKNNIIFSLWSIANYFFYTWQKT